MINMGKERVNTLDISNPIMLAAVDNKIKREEYKIDSLLGRAQKQEEWDFKSPDAHRYRRRMLPFYLLEKESNAYPVYVDNSDMKNMKTQKVRAYKICEITVDGPADNEKHSLKMK